MADIRLVARGLRGESFADVRRRLGLSPSDATDEEVMDAFTAELGVSQPGENLFTGAVETGKELYGDGTLQPEANSVTTELIPVRGMRAVTVDELSPNTAFQRYYAFYEADGVTRVGGSTYLAADLNFLSVAVPDGAVYFRMSPKQRSSATSYSSVEITASAEPYAAKSFLLFGDSITETEDIDAVSPKVVYGSDTRPNWPDYALPSLHPSAAFNYANSGARFSSASGATTYQKLENQIALAITDGRTPDVVVVSIGTNDWGNSTTSGGGSIVLGDYTTAMGKAIGSLDKNVSMEAARFCFYTIQNQWPNARLFYCTPLQRADFTPDAMTATVDAFARMAQRYGFEVIDCFRESGIVADFENNGAPGRDLSDGLHPDASGQAKQGQLIAARLRARLAA